MRAPASAAAAGAPGVEAAPAGEVAHETEAASQPAEPFLRAALVAHLFSLAAGAVLLVWVNRGQWFFGDEWDFIALRMHSGVRSLFVPHSEHWSTVPILIYRALYAAFGIRSYLPYVAVLVVLHVAVTHLLWRLMRRTGTTPIVATALSAVFVVLGAGFENLLWAFQIGFVGSVAVGLAHVLVVDHPGPFGRRDRAGWLVAVTGLMFSGIGVTMTVVAGLVVLLRRGFRDAALTVVPPALVFLAWLGWVGKDGLSSHERTLDGVLQLPEYVWTGLSHALEESTGIPAAGAALVILLSLWLLRQADVRGAAAAAPTAMALGAAVMFVVIGVGRSTLGIEQATSSRYVYISFALLVPTLGRALSDVSSGLVTRQLAIAALLALPLLHNVALLRQFSRAESGRELADRAQIVAAARLARSGAELVGTFPEYEHSPNLTMEGLARLDRDGALPDIRTGELDELAAAVELQVALSDTPPAAPAPSGRPTVPVVEGLTAEGPDCMRLVAPARAEVRFSTASSVAVESAAGGELSVILLSNRDRARLSPPRTFTVAPGATRWLHVSRSGPVVVTLPQGGGGRLCGVQPGPP